MTSLDRPFRFTPRLGVALLLVAGLLVGACDPFTGSSQRGTLDPGSSAPANATLEHAHMPAGTSLPAPGEVPLKNGTVQAYQERRRPPAAAYAGSNRSRADRESVESPYGCYLASQPYTDAVRFRSVYLYFPEEMVEAAGEGTKRVRFSLEAASVEDSASVAGSDLGAAARQREQTGVRYANCVIPSAPGAEGLANKQLIQAGEDAATADALRSTDDQNARGKRTRKNQVCFIQEVTYCASIGYTCRDWKTDYYVTCFRTGSSGSDDGGGGYPDTGGGTSGGGGGDGGDDGGQRQCTNPQPGETCEPSDLCDLRNPPSHCDVSDVNDEKVCPSDPLRKMRIRATGCTQHGNRSLEGGRFEGRGGAHKGLDLLADVGTNLRAIGGGKVRRVGFDEGGWGNYVVIKSSSEDNKFFLYAHLDLVDIERGDFLSEGDLIGETGTSGNASDDPCHGGPAHLHLEVLEGASQWYNAAPVDPENHLGTEFNSGGEAISDSCSS